MNEFKAQTKTLMNAKGDEALPPDSEIKDVLNQELGREPTQ